MLFRKSINQKTPPKLTTSSLPDIVFMLLFFFMVATVLRNNEIRLRLHIPAISEVEKLRHRSLINYIYLGPPLNPNLGTEAVIQINDAFVEAHEVGQAARSFRENTSPADRNRIRTALKVDQDVTMGIVDEVKQSLRKAEHLRIHYIANPLTTDN